MRLLKALPQVLRRQPRTRVMLVGPGDSDAYGRALRGWVTAQGLEGRVLFTGAVPHQELPHYYAAADVFVLLSSAEGMPEALLEAMSCGLACLASDIPNHREVAATGEELRLVAPGDASAVAEALGDLLADKRARARMGKLARRLVMERFRWEALVGEMETVYTKALSVPWR